MAFPRYKYKTEFARKYFYQGFAQGFAETFAETFAERFLKGSDGPSAEAIYKEGRVEVVIAILEDRELSVSDEQRAVIRGCTDLPTLERWVERSALVSSTEELFV